MHCIVRRTRKTGLFFPFFPFRHGVLSEELTSRCLQIEAVSVAVKNLAAHSTLMSQTYSKFALQFEVDQATHADLLATFEEDLARVRVVWL